MEVRSNWIMAISASLVAAAIGGIWTLSSYVSRIDTRLATIETRGSSQLIATDERVTRVEERQKGVIIKLDEILKELHQHEKETKSK